MQDQCQNTARNVLCTLLDSNAKCFE